MPWTSRTVIEARQEFVTLASSPRANIRALCRKFNVSPKTAYKLLARVRTMGPAGYQDRSRRPRHNPSRTPAEIENEVFSVRASHPLWGGRRIAGELRRRGRAKIPAPSTITTMLSRRGALSPADAMGAITSIPADPAGELPACCKVRMPPAVGASDLRIVIEHLLRARVLNRRRAMVLLTHWLGVRQSMLCGLIGLSPITWRRCLRVYAEGGVDSLFARRRSPTRKFDSEELRNALFDTLHRPPSEFGINRTTWKVADLGRVLAQRGQAASEETVRKIIKSSGYKWRKARIVLTSNDPEFAQKVDRIKSILSNLAPDEAFFSIDEFGPFAVKHQPGRSLTAPGERPLVQQWQKSRGTVTLTAAIELSSNQVTHFYSEKKNTAEMIRMMKVLLDKYRDRSCIYLSWDAASWHVSKELNQTVEHHNSRIVGPTVVIAPLPARAQFLNVIESVFSGMARAIIHNSNYQSPDEAKAAIDRYFEERNEHFRANPRRAGNKIWGKERVPAEFSQSNNCKDPRLG
ncbi:IS630 family transposase [Bradyrhizobium liaoningense]|uniref:IS630 family transposase n=1 Tax=Bradyrhizobium liaoningense TaxID=43992 RepID=UPI001BAB9888|nr:IS630 family transposase [Bradyrhizobium liaoningense]MBR0708638.1 IS630 family transposase [Bradyrhizobium liaoningense]